MKNRLIAAAFVVLATLACPGGFATPFGVSWAQESDSPAEDGGDRENVPDDDRDPPYQARLLRLSEIVGSVHYLRQICDGGAQGGSEDSDVREQDATDWRALMQSLIDAEAASPALRQRLTAAFNRGYRAFASVYTGCTPAARLADERYRDEGATLASEIIARFGN